MSDIRNLEIDLDIKQNLLVTINCKQLDNLNLKFNIWDNGQVADLSNYKCRLKALKSDQIPLIQNTDISISGNIVTAEADEQLTTTSGLVKTELQFIDKTTGKKKSTFNLNIKVISSTLEVDRTISKATITLLNELDNKLDQVEDIGTVLDEAIIVKADLNNNIATANTTKTALETATTNANNKKNEVNTAITNATNKIIEVNTSITNANASKTALDSSKEIADTSKSNLDSANTLAEANIEELNKLGDVTDLAIQVQTNTNNISDLEADKTDILTTIGTENMGTTTTTLKGAIAEHENQINDNTTQLNDLANTNLFINGGFSVWQRGTSFNKGNEYTVDRWMYDVEGDDKGKIVRHANGGVQIKLISNKRFWFMQRIELNQELKNIFSNSTVTLSFYVTTSAGVKISPYIRVWSPSRNANIFLKSYEAKATRQLIECQITLGDLSSDDWLGIDIFRIEEDNKFTVGDDLYIRFENAKLELGTKATPFVPRLFGEELALCQRYYQTVKNNVDRGGIIAIQYHNGLGYVNYNIGLPIPLRIIPTMTYSLSVNNKGRFISNITGNETSIIEDITLISRGTGVDAINVSNLFLRSSLNTPTSYPRFGWVDGFTLYLDSEIY